MESNANMNENKKKLQWLLYSMENDDKNSFKINCYILVNRKNFVNIGNLSKKKRVEF